MRSNEVAQLAGVSVRTLRHYHAIGILPEPPRTANGYRDYGFEHLARLLRIRQLTSLGFPLSQVGDVLAEMDAAAGREGSAAASLDALDADLAARIEELQEQRRVIAQLKRERLDPDLPPRFARAAKALHVSVADAPGGMSADDRNALLVAGHLYGEQDLQELERVSAAVVARGLLEPLNALDNRVAQLPADAPEDTRRALTADALALLGQIIDCFDPTNWLREDTFGEQQLEQYLTGTQNEAQNDVVARIERGLREQLAAKPLDPDVAS